MKVLKKENLKLVYDRLSEAADLYLPIQHKDQSGFFSWKSFNSEVDEVILDTLNVYQPPKNVVLPQTERMYDFNHEGTEVDITQVHEDNQPRIIFGIRACDAAAIDCLDQVFFTRGYEDGYYKARRSNTVLIANACYEPGVNCFCESMGVDYRNPASADIVISKTINQDYLWSPKTPKGEEISGKVADLLVEGEPELMPIKPFKTKVEYDGTAEALKNLFSHPVWEELSDSCQNCGICTYLCPSCYCFDIQVKTFGDKGYRFRCWDSCMYKEYSLMAGGHNPREASTERFRNRFLHKLQFFKERYGTSLCTGCGRCIVACPAGINITKVISTVKEVKSNA